MDLVHASTTWCIHALEVGSSNSVVISIDHEVKSRTWHEFP